MNQCLVMLIVNSMARHTCIYKQIPCPTSLISERSQEMLISHQNMKDIRASADLSTLYFILMTLMCDSGVIMSGEIRCWSLLGVKWSKGQRKEGKKHEIFFPLKL